MRYRPEQHLRRQGEIRATREQGRRIECGAFSLFWLVRPEPPEGVVPVRGPRVCTVASIAAVGKSVQRSLAKRRLRELFRRHQDKLPETVDLMLVSRAACIRVEFAELERRYVQACEKISREAARLKPAGGAGA